MTRPLIAAVAAVLLLAAAPLSAQPATGGTATLDQMAHAAFPEPATTAGSHDHDFTCRILTPPNTGRGAHAPNLWPGGIVPYEFDPAISQTSLAHGYFLDAKAWIEQVCSVRFVPRTNEADYLVVSSPSRRTIESHVGRIGGSQPVTVGPQVEGVVHALMHTLGFWHEFQRPDRDQYVEMVLFSVPDEILPGYQIVPGAIVHGPYDFNSIMHRRLSWHTGFRARFPYDRRWYTSNGGTGFGEGLHLSRGDILSLRALYGADREPCVMTSNAERIVPSDPIEGALFGGPSAFWQDWMFVSAFGHEWGSNGPWGSVYAYREVNGTWALEQQFAPPPNIWARFGQSMVADGGRLIVSGLSTNQGRLLHVYELAAGEEWTLVDVIRSSVIWANDSFGTGSDLAGNTLVVGSPGDDTTNGDAGSVTVYEHDGSDWVEAARLVPDTSPIGGNFGASVSISGDVLAIGMPFDTVGCIGVESDCGSVYVYRRDAFGGWNLEQQLWLDGSNRLQFGYDVKVHDDTILVGSLNGVYAYTHDNAWWQFEGRITPSDLNALDRYGTSIEYDGRTLVVGAPIDDDEGNGSGAAYVFQQFGTGWVEVAKLTVPAGWHGDALGSHVAVRDGTVAAAAGGHDGGCVDPQSTDCGALFLYRGFGDCDGNGVTDLCDIASGAADADEDGIVDGCDGAVCPADITHDERVNIWDLLRYLDYWFDRHVLAERTGDLIPEINEFDLIAYLDDWFSDGAGACGG